MFKRIDHIEIIPRNLEESVRFYTEIFGFQVKHRQRVPAPPLEEVVYLSLADTVLELLSVRDPIPPSQTPWRVGYRMMAIEVEEMDQALAYLRSKGVEISKEPVVLGKSKRAEIKDPDGLSIELRQW